MNFQRLTLAICLCASTITGCSQANAPTTHSGAVVGAKISAPFTVSAERPLHLDIASASKIDEMSNMKASVVLIEGSTAYVGVFPEHKGMPKPGQVDRTRYTWPKTWDTQKGLAKLTPDDFMRALESPARRADTYDYRPRSRSGLMPHVDQVKITHFVQSAHPEVRRVHITSDVASTAMLHGYADFITRGGDMTKFMPTFHARMMQIWPNGKGVSLDRPSASPSFGALGQPVDKRAKANPNSTGT